MRLYHGCCAAIIIIVNMVIISGNTVVIIMTIVIHTLKLALLRRGSSLETHLPLTCYLCNAPDRGSCICCTVPVLTLIASDDSTLAHAVELYLGVEVSLRLPVTGALVAFQIKWVVLCMCQLVSTLHADISGWLVNHAAETI